MQLQVRIRVQILEMRPEERIIVPTMLWKGKGAGGSTQIENRIEDTYEQKRTQGQNFQPVKWIHNQIPITNKCEEARKQNAHGKAANNYLPQNTVPYYWIACHLLFLIYRLKMPHHWRFEVDRYVLSSHWQRTVDEQTMRLTHDHIPKYM